jgi:hypothetical protein
VIAAALLVASSWGRASSRVEFTELCQLIQASSQTLVYAPTITTADRALAQCLFDAARTYRRSVVILSIRHFNRDPNSLLYGLLLGNPERLRLFEGNVNSARGIVVVGPYTYAAPNLGFGGGAQLELLPLADTGRYRAWFSSALGRARAVTALDVLHRTPSNP